MFGEKCSRCGKRVRKSHDFCPSCGLNLNNGEEDYGLLGKNDEFDLDMKMPFGFKMLFKPLLKELNRQMIELDRELKKEGKDLRKPGDAKFSIHIKTGGNKPIKLNNADVPRMSVETPQTQKEIQTLSLPRISRESLDKVKKFPRKEPETNVRRLSDKIIYEISLPGVSSLSKVNIRQLDSAMEVKAISKKEVFLKSINVGMPLSNYYLSSEKLVLEFILEK